VDREPPLRSVLGCSQVVLDFLSTTGVGKLFLAEEDAGSEVSEWELCERREREYERRVEAEELGAEGEEPHMAPAEADYGAGRDFLRSFFCLSLVRFISWDRLGQWAKRSLQRAANVRTADGDTAR